MVAGAIPCRWTRRQTVSERPQAGAEEDGREGWAPLVQRVKLWLWAGEQQ